MTHHCGCPCGCTNPYVNPTAECPDCANGDHQNNNNLAFLTTYFLATAQHRTFDAGTDADGSEWMVCDCHGAYLKRSVTDGKRGPWMVARLIPLQKMGGNADAGDNA